MGFVRELPLWFLLVLIVKGVIGVIILKFIYDKKRKNKPKENS